MAIPDLYMQGGPQLVLTVLQLQDPQPSAKLKRAASCRERRHWSGMIAREMSLRLPADQY